VEADLKILILRAAGFGNPAERKRTKAERAKSFKRGTGGSRVLPPVLRDRKESSAVMRKQIEKMNTLFLCISSG
jgi:hypothetical protein